MLITLVKCLKSLPFGCRLEDATSRKSKQNHHIFNLRSLRLLSVEDLARTAVLRSQSQHVLASESCNRTIQNRGAAGPLADFLRDLRRQLPIPLLAHQRQRPLDSIVGNEAQEG